MKIVFVVNTLGLTGGIKVVFIHANNLVNQGHDVSIIHLLKLEESLKGSLVGALKSGKYIASKLFHKPKPNWFSLDPKIDVSHRSSLKGIDDYDAIIATANETADWVAKLPNEKGGKFYFVQDYEYWSREQELVDKTYTLPLKKIVSSSWIKNILKEKFNEDSVGIVFNGVDYEKFNIEEKQFNQNKIILMQYHFLERKGIDIGLEALKEIKQRYPNVQIKMFGMYKPQHTFPDGTEYFFDLPQKQLVELYQKADIFISSSLQEGFSMPPMEAMAAKCAVISTDVGAVPDYATHNETALIVPKGDKKVLIDAMEELLEEEEKLIRLATNANKHIQQFTWEEASREFERILKENIKN